MASAKQASPCSLMDVLRVVARVFSAAPAGAADGLEVVTASGRSPSFRWAWTSVNVPLMRVNATMLTAQNKVTLIVAVRR